MADLAGRQPWSGGRQVCDQTQVKRFTSYYCIQKSTRRDLPHLNEVGDLNPSSLPRPEPQTGQTWSGMLTAHGTLCQHRGLLIPGCRAQALLLCGFVSETHINEHSIYTVRYHNTENCWTLITHVPLGSQMCGNSLYFFTLLPDTF